MFNNIKYVCKKYNFLLKQLVARDFKVKYKRSVLGVLWSLLYPVLTMAVMALVFSKMFKFQTDVNYLAYLMSGLVIFNYFSEASNLAMSSVVANFSLINKVYMPKYIFPLSKCIFVGINFLLSQIPLYVILIFTEGLSWHHVFLPYAYICLFFFTLGFSLILSTLAVFLRDMFYIYGVIISLWTYMTPIMYDLATLETLRSPVVLTIFKCNPLYWIIYFERRIMLYHQIPEINTWFYCAGCAIIFLILGIIVFKKNQDKFIYYV